MSGKANKLKKLEVGSVDWLREAIQRQINAFDFLAETEENSSLSSLLENLGRIVALSLPKNSSSASSSQDENSNNAPLSTSEQNSSCDKTNVNVNSKASTSTSTTTLHLSTVADSSMATMTTPVVLKDKETTTGFAALLLDKETSTGFSTLLEDKETSTDIIMMEVINDYGSVNDNLIEMMETGENLQVEVLSQLSFDKEEDVEDEGDEEEFNFMINDQVEEKWKGDQFQKNDLLSQSIQDADNSMNNTNDDSGIASCSIVSTENDNSHDNIDTGSPFTIIKWEEPQKSGSGLEPKLKEFEYKPSLKCPPPPPSLPDSEIDQDELQEVEQGQEEGQSQMSEVIVQDSSLPVEDKAQAESEIEAPAEVPVQIPIPVSIEIPAQISVQVPAQTSVQVQGKGHGSKSQCQGQLQNQNMWTNPLILSKIFKYLSTKELTRCRLVNSPFHESATKILQKREDLDLDFAFSEGDGKFIRKKVFFGGLEQERNKQENNQGKSPATWLEDLVPCVEASRSSFPCLNFSFSGSDLDSFDLTDFLCEFGPSIRRLTLDFTKSCVGSHAHNPGIRLFDPEDLSDNDDDCHCHFCNFRRQGRPNNNNNNVNANGAVQGQGQGQEGQGQDQDQYRILRQIFRRVAMAQMQNQENGDYVIPSMDSFETMLFYQAQNIQTLILDNLPIQWLQDISIEQFNKETLEKKHLLPHLKVIHLPPGFYMRDHEENQMMMRRILQAAVNLQELHFYTEEYLELVQTIGNTGIRAIKSLHFMAVGAGKGVTSVDDIARFNSILPGQQENANNNNSSGEFIQLRSLKVQLAAVRKATFCAFPLLHQNARGSNNNNNNVDVEVGCKSSRFLTRLLKSSSQSLEKLSLEPLACLYMATTSNFANYSSILQLPEEFPKLTILQLKFLPEHPASRAESRRRSYKRFRYFGLDYGNHADFNDLGPSTDFFEDDDSDLDDPDDDEDDDDYEDYEDDYDDYEDDDEDGYNYLGGDYFYPGRQPLKCLTIDEENELELVQRPARPTLMAGHNYGQNPKNGQGSKEVKGQGQNSNANSNFQEIFPSGLSLSSLFPALHTVLIELVTNDDRYISRHFPTGGSAIVIPTVQNLEVRYSMTPGWLKKMKHLFPNVTSLGMKVKLNSGADTLRMLWRTWPKLEQLCFFNVVVVNSSGQNGDNNNNVQGHRKNSKSKNGNNQKDGSNGGAGAGPILDNIFTGIKEKQLKKLRKESDKVSIEELSGLRTNPSICDLTNLVSLTMCLTCLNHKPKELMSHLSGVYAFALMPNLRVTVAYDQTDTRAPEIAASLSGIAPFIKIVGLNEI